MEKGRANYPAFFLTQLFPLGDNVLASLSGTTGGHRISCGVVGEARRPHHITCRSSLYALVPSEQDDPSSAKTTHVSPPPEPSPTPSSFPEHASTAENSLPDPWDVPPGHKSGFVAVVGRPNVGKSTLMNAYLGQKIAIVSPKPQTTRTRIRGILTRPDAQIIFVDTPGIHFPKDKLGEFMVSEATGALPDADVILWLVDLSEPPGPEEKHIAQLIARERNNRPVILALNKKDRVSGIQAQLHRTAYLQLLEPDAWLEISALTGENLDALLEHIIHYLPEGPRYFPEEMITDQQERDIVAEIIREKALHFLQQEVPYAVAVVVNEFKERSEDLVYISAWIVVERPTQKMIVLGEKGRMIKKIGQAAREEIEHLLGKRVYLDLWVKVKPKWRKKEIELARLGYKLPRKRRRKRRK